MIKYILPAIIIFLIILFWEKITESVYKKFDIDINTRGVSVYVNDNN